MKKSQEEALGIVILVAAGLLVLPFVLVYLAGGWPGLLFFILLLVALGVWIYKRYMHKKAELAQKDREDFNDLVLLTLRTRLKPAEEKRLNFNLAQSDFKRASMIRELQIMRDSRAIALASKKKDVAESRVQTMVKCYQTILRESSGLVPKETMEEITRFVDESQRLFPARLTMNMAEAHLEKVKKVKTAKTKTKYLLLTRDILSEGISECEIGRGEMESKLEDIQGMIDDLADAK